MGAYVLPNSIFVASMILLMESHVYLSYEKCLCLFVKLLQLSCRVKLETHTNIVEAAVAI